jgi:hypothetical protein
MFFFFLLVVRGLKYLAIYWFGLFNHGMATLHIYIINLDLNETQTYVEHVTHKPPTRLSVRNGYRNLN